MCYEKLHIYIYIYIYMYIMYIRIKPANKKTTTY